MASVEVMVGLVAAAIVYDIDGGVYLVRDGRCGCNDRRRRGFFCAATEEQEQDPNHENNHHYWLIDVLHEWIGHVLMKRGNVIDRLDSGGEAEQNKPYYAFDYALHEIPLPKNW